MPAQPKRIDEKTRRRFLKGITIGGIGAAGALALSRTVGGLPGAGVGGVTISDMDVDAKRIAGIRIASEFADGPHAGTDADPWPGSAIQSAINDLPAVGGLVFVPAGSWVLSSDVTMPMSNVTLMGMGRATRIFTLATNQHQMFFNGGTSSSTQLTGVHVKGIHFDGSQMANPGSINVLVLRNCLDSSVSDCWFTGAASASVATMLVQGGKNFRVANNNFIAAPGAGGSQLQCNSLGGTPNLGLLLANNHLDSCSILVIGWDRVLISGNIVTNRTLGNYIARKWTNAYTGTNNGITVAGNVIDASTGPNSAVISGLGNDVGGAGFINDLVIHGNHIRGAYPTIEVQEDAAADTITTSRVQITNNYLRASATGNRAAIILTGKSKTVTDVLCAFNKLSGPDAPRIVTDANTIDFRLYGNKGVQPTGVAVITVGGSPFTYTNNDGVPQAVYVSGGTVSNISKDSMIIFTGTPATVWLEPGESVILTYSAAPTMTKDRK